MAQDSPLSSQAVVSANQNQVVFKAPAIPKRRIKLRKPKVLDEEAYLENMGKIIERDFFPDLEKLKARNEYLDALNKNDIRKLREIHAKYTSGTRLPTSRYSSPMTFETPIDTRPGEDESLREEPGLDEEFKKPEIPQENKKLSLDEYLSNHTSEDNQSFEEIIKESALQHQQKHTWLYKLETSNQEALNEKLQVPSIEDQAIGKERPLELDSWGYKNKNYIMFVPDGVQLTPEEKIEMAKRKQEIVHSNTRLKTNPFDENQNKEKIQGLAQSQAKHLDGKIGVDGKELVAETPKVNGFSFIKTPSPAPGVTDSPLMTWGEIEGTPFRLDSPLGAAPGPAFWIPAPPKRERLALRLADRDRKKRAEEAAAKKARRTPTVERRAPTVERLASMSPAARKLASSHIKLTDRALLASYSPRPSPGPHATPVSPARGSTPSRTPQVTSITTDNLLKLNLPRRPRASDFFE